MLVDTSLWSQYEDPQGSKVDVMGIIEYTEDINLYLREAEVSGASTSVLLHWYIDSGHRIFIFI